MTVVTKPMTVQVNVPVPIEYPDIIAWLNDCQDPGVLRNISIIAARYASQLENRPPIHPDFQGG